MNASVKRRENSIFALNPAEGSILISIDGKGTPNSGQIICRFGQPAWYRWILICSRARIPGSFFAAENHLQSSNSLPIAWTNAFGHLGVLNLRVIFPASSSSLSDEPLSALKDLIPALSELTDSDLSFGRDEIGGINNFNLTHVFETFLVFKNLQYLALAGLAATQYQLRHFLHNHRSIVRLTIEDLMIFAEDWGGVLDDIRETLFNMKANDLVQPLLRFTGESVENLI